MTPFVHFDIVGNAASPVRFGGNNGGRATLVQGCAQPIVVEGFVADKGFKIEPCDQGLDTDAVVTLARQKNEADKIAERIDECHDFGRQPPRASGLWPDFESPFSAGAMLVDPDERAIDEDIFEIGVI